MGGELSGYEAGGVMGKHRIIGTASKGKALKKGKLLPTKKNLAKKKKRVRQGETRGSN